MIHSKQKITLMGILMLSVLIPASLYAQSVPTDGSNESTTTRQQYIRGWRGQSSDLQQKINALGSASTSSVYMPVLFGVEIRDISPNFGDPRSGGRTHEGEDIMAVKGTPIVSPTNAVVIRTGVGVGEGNYVYTANPGGETFVYMHLDKFGEGVVSGTVLERGSLIGYVGNTGNAAGGPAHLHFEIHNTSNAPTDPFPRLTGTFSAQEKMQFLTKILTQTSDQNALAQFLVIQFRSTFTNAITLGASIPQIITTYLASTPDTGPILGSNLPAGDLALNSSGSAVVQLQQYLIAKNVGPFAVRLAKAGPTGNFGPITQSALIEYQASVGISPANGYYGLTTRTVIEANPLPSTPTSIPPTTSGGTTLTRDISLNSVGEDVRTLQKFLNAHGFMVSATGAGSIGYETRYFGNATRNAVIRFQIANHISPAVGYVGPLTRNILQSLGI